MESRTTEKVKRSVVALVLVSSVILITLIHYQTSAGGNFLLHEISQRLYYVPIVYAAYRFGVRGSVTISLLSSAVYLLHISEHGNDPKAAILNQYAEVMMFLVVGVVTGLLAQAEKTQRRRSEKASTELAAAYKELRGTVDLLIRADRLKSLGELAAGMAHEVRNPLSAIRGAAEIIDKEIPPDSPRRKFVGVIEEEVDRLNRLVGEFLSFAKPRQPERTPTDLSELVESVVTFTSKEADNNGVKLVTRLDEQLQAVPVDREQIRQVLLNLIINAIHAMPEGGTVEIGTSLGSESVELWVRDYGIGVEPGTRDKIFDPFFTTKQQGSGLGLSIAYQIVKQHGGEIEFRDVDGPGALFVIRLPIAPALAAGSSSHIDIGVIQESR
jgi:two-component system, NtrC family, sensor histidine kinase HydH